MRLLEEVNGSWRWQMRQGGFLSDFRLQEEVGCGQTIASKRGAGNFSKVECEWCGELSVKDGHRVAQ